MKNKIVSLLDMVKLSDSDSLSEKYVRYICGIEPERQYKHQEILDVKCLLDNIYLPVGKADGFIFGYVVPQLNKEFDLLKITDSVCLNIELKSCEVSVEKIKRQLRQNTHYLKLLNKRTLLSFLFVSSTMSVFTLDEQDEVVEATLQDVRNAIISSGDIETVDLDRVFLPSNILVSPLNSTDRFYKRITCLLSIRKT